MGHIINAKLYRLGYTTFWYNRLFSPRKAVYAQESALYFKLDSYFKSVFSYSPYFAKQGLVYAFLSISKDNLGLCGITVYYHDPLLDRFFLNFSKDFFANWFLLRADRKKNAFLKTLRKKTQILLLRSPIFQLFDLQWHNVVMGFFNPLFVVGFPVISRGSSVAFP